MTNIDDVAQRLSEYERLAVTSGARVQIDPPEYSADGVVWAPFWISTGHPTIARATVHRDEIPTTVYAAWDESIPIDTAQTEDGRLWRDIWDSKPMERFGSFVVRAALRRAFREVIGEPVEADEDAPKIAVPERDWDAEIAATADADAVHALHDAMKQARAVTPAREGALRARLAETVTEAWATAPLDAPESIVGPVSRPPVRDYLPPVNRAARRKKGGRRK